MTDFERLKEIRERLKFKQGDFAALIGLQQGSYSDVERGKANITYNLLGKLYELFKINPIFIMIGEGSWILDKSNNSDEILNIDEILDKSNNLDKSEGKVLGKVEGKVGYVLSTKEQADRVEEEQAQYSILQPHRITTSPPPPPDTDILKTEIAFLKELLKSKEAALNHEITHLNAIITEKERFIQHLLSQTK